MELHTVARLANTPTGRALLEHAHYCEREARRLGCPGAACDDEQQALYATLARRAREAFRRLKELEAQPGPPEANAGA